MGVELAFPDAAAQQGFLYDGSLMGSDHAYELTAGDSSLVEVPINWSLHDWEQYCDVPGFSGSRLIESPSKAIDLWRLEFDAMRVEGGCFVLTNHPFLSGRSSRAHALRGLIDYVCAQDDVRVASLDEIANHVRGLGLSPRAFRASEPRAAVRSMNRGHVV